MSKLTQVLIKYLFPILLSIMFFFISLLSIKDRSFTTDETSHVIRGVMLIKTFDFRLNQHHPYLFNVIHSLPIAYNKDLRTEDVTEENWKYARKDAMGSNIVTLNGGTENFSINYLYYGRALSVFLSAGFLLIFFFLTQKEWGTIPAYISFSLLAFSPTVIAHSSLVTTDMPALITIFGGTYALYKHIKNGSNKIPWLFILLSFIALLTKYTAVLVVPIWLISLIIFYIFVKRFSLGAIIKHLVVILLSWLLLLTAAYGFQFKTLKETDYEDKGRIGSTLDNFSSIDRALPFDTYKGMKFIYEKVKLPFPQYIKGFYDNVFKHNYHGHSTYLLGRSYNGRDLKYFPTAFSVKETLPTVILTVFSLVYTAIQFCCKKFRVDVATLPLILTPMFILILSLFSGINIGIRHILPIYPFLFIFIGVVISKSKVHNRFLTILIAILLLFQFTTLYNSFPFYIEYYNEMVGKYGYLYVDDSNFDWKQDRIEIIKYMNDHPHTYTDVSEIKEFGFLIISKSELTGKLSQSHTDPDSLFCLRDKFLSKDIAPVDRINRTQLVFQIDKSTLCKY